MPWKGYDLQLSPAGMLSTILLRGKSTEVEGSTWEVAEGVKAHVHPGEQDQDRPGTQQVQGPSSSLPAATQGSHRQKRDKPRGSLPTTMLRAMVASRTTKRRNKHSAYQSKWQLGNILNFGTSDQPITLLSPCFFHLNS